MQIRARSSAIPLRRSRSYGLHCSVTQPLKPTPNFDSTLPASPFAYSGPFLRNHQQNAGSSLRASPLCVANVPAPIFGRSDVLLTVSDVLGSTPTTLSVWSTIRQAESATFAFHKEVRQHYSRGWVSL